MKNLIITIGMIIFIMTMMGMQSSCNHMLHTRQEMKFAADEAAATAALCIDRRAFGEGLIRLDRVEAERSARIMAHMNLREQNYDFRIEFPREQDAAVRVVITEGRLSVTSEYEYVAF